MDHRIKLLINAFENNGWVSQGSLDISGDWWFEDIILLVSTWHPAGTKLYITLITDPMFIDSKVVWALHISNLLPSKRDTKFIAQLTLNEIKATDLDKFAKNVNITALADS